MSSICCIGHLTHDRIITPRRTVEMTGGVAYYLSHALARLPQHVAYTLVTKVSADDYHAVETLRAAGVEVRCSMSRATVFFENRYGANPDERTQRVLATSEPFTLADVEGIDADIFHLGTLLCDDFDITLAAALHQRGRLAIDAQGFLRRVVGMAVKACSWQEKETFLKYVDIIKVNEEELFALTETDDIERGMQQIAALGPQEVIATLGSLGSQILYNGERIVIPAYPARNVVDATGSGDTYMAGYLYCRAQAVPPAQAGRFAAAMCTLKLAQHGPFAASLDDIRKIIEKE